MYVYDIATCCVLDISLIGETLHLYSFNIVMKIVKKLSLQGGR